MLATRARSGSSVTRTVPAPSGAYRSHPWFAPRMSSLTSSPAWTALSSHKATIDRTTMRELFAADSGRAARMSRDVCGLFVDYSKHRVTDETLRLLAGLAQQQQVESWRDRMFA